MKPTKEEITTALTDAGAAHHDYETVALHGVRDEQWSGWYAAYVLGRLGDFTTPSHLAGLLRSAPSTDNWADSTATFVVDNLS